MQCAEEYTMSCRFPGRQNLAIDERVGSFDRQAAINAVEKEIGRIYRSRLPFFRQAKASNIERVLNQVKSIYFESFDAFLAHVPAGE